MISIRAPARGATVHIMPPSADFIISIRAPARGATLPPFPHSRPYVISIRAPARGATYAYRMYQTDTEISIRAPARGATQPLCCRGCKIRISIRAPARGATKDGKYYSICWAFQSALPRGERQELKSLTIITANFNPRSREGSDLFFLMLCIFTLISIRAPARGATRPSGGTSSIFLFQSALPRGERRR